MTPLSEQFKPSLTIAVVVGEQRQRARQTIQAVYEQSVAEQLELVVVDMAPEASELGLTAPRVSRGSEGGGRLSSVEAAPTQSELLVTPTYSMPTRYLPVGNSLDLPSARVEAIRCARAPLIAFTEDHAMPKEDFAEAILRFAERRIPGESWVAASWAYANANPDSWMSWAGFIADYSEWIYPIPDGITRLACNNVVYHRPTLLSLDVDLAGLLGSDFVLCEQLRRRGFGTEVIKEAIAYHQNPERFKVLWTGNLAHCRLIAAGRVSAEGWSWGRRILYALTVPIAVPFMKLRRVARAQLRRKTLGWITLRSLPVMLAIFVGSSFAEGVGYLFGSGRAIERFREMEISELRSEAFERSA